MRYLNGNQAMKNIIKGLYYYYSYGATSNVAYFKTLSVLVLAIFLHFMQLRIALLKYTNIKVDLPFTETNRYTQYLIMFLLMVPIYLLLRKLLPEQSLKEHNLSKQKLIQGRNVFFLYALSSLLLLIVLVWEFIKFKK